MKNLRVTYGPKGDQKTEHVQLLGILSNTKLTPKIARQAARIACGHMQGVRVMDGNIGYILYSEKRNSYRKVNIE